MAGPRSARPAFCTSVSPSLRACGACASLKHPNLAALRAHAGIREERRRGDAEVLSCRFPPLPATNPEPHAPLLRPTSSSSLPSVQVTYHHARLFPSLGLEFAVRPSRIVEMLSGQLMFVDCYGLFLVTFGEASPRRLRKVRFGIGLVIFLPPCYQALAFWA